MVQWCGGAGVQWCGGAVVQWCSGAVVWWCGGAVVRWCGGAVVQWWCLRDKHMSSSASVKYMHTSLSSMSRLQSGRSSLEEGSSNAIRPYRVLVA